MSDSNIGISKRPRLSIVTVCLNAGEELAKTVRSAISQSFQDFEIIIKDGGSSDGSLNKLPEDPRIQVISREDTGIYDAMNKALHYCNGDYVHFLNSGDYYYSSTSLEKLINFIADDYEINIVSAFFIHDGFEVIFKPPKRLTDFYLFRKNICHQVLFMKRSLLLSLGGFDKEYAILADRDLLIRSFRANKNSYRLLPKVIVRYRGGGISEDYGSRVLFREELKKIRTVHFTYSKYLFYKLFHELTMFRLRVFFSAKIKSKLLHKIYYYLANHINHM